MPIECSWCAESDLPLHTPSATANDRLACRLCGASQLCGWHWREHDAEHEPGGAHDLWEDVGGALLVINAATHVCMEPEQAVERGLRTEEQKRLVERVGWDERELTLPARNAAAALIAFAAAAETLHEADEPELPLPSEATVDEALDVDWDALAVHLRSYATAMLRAAREAQVVARRVGQVRRVRAREEKRLLAREAIWERRRARSARLAPDVGEGDEGDGEDA